jgi:hypothetical protein
MDNTKKNDDGSFEKSELIDHVRAGKNKFPQYVEKTLGLSHEAGEAAG